MTLTEIRVTCGVFLETNLQGYIDCIHELYHLFAFQKFGSIFSRLCVNFICFDNMQKHCSITCQQDSEENKFFSISVAITKLKFHSYLDHVMSKSPPSTEGYIIHRLYNHLYFLDNFFTVSKLNQQSDIPQVFNLA